MINYSYQYDSNKQIIARVASSKVIIVSDSFTSTDRLEVVSWIYDTTAKDVYIPIRGSDGALVLSGGNPQRDLTQSDKTIKV